MKNSIYPLAMPSWDQEEVDAACAVIRSMSTTMGKYVYTFEKQFSEYIGCSRSFMVNSGSSANLLMASALKIYLDLNHDSRRTILIPAVGWSTSYAPFIQLGFNVRLVDISIETFNICHQTIANEDWGDDLVGILAINVLGNPCDLERLSSFCLQKSIFLLEDNCESLGAEVKSSNGYKRAGSYGIMASHSFFFSHHMNTMEGGCVCTSSDEFALILKIIRNHGWIRDLTDQDLDCARTPVTIFISDALALARENSSYELLKDFYFILPGYNLRPTEIQGALGSIQLRKLPGFIEQRRKNALLMRNLTSSSDLISLQKEFGRSSYFGFGFIAKHASRRDEICRHLLNSGIQTRPIVSGNIALHPLSIYMEKDYFPNASTLHDAGFFIGNHHVSFSKEISLFSTTLDEII